MQWDHRLYLQDAIQVREQSVSKTRQNLINKFETFVNWSYAPAEKCCRKAPGGLLKLRQASASVDAIKLDVARNNNREVIKLLFPYFSSINGNFYPVDKERYRIGLNTSVQNRLFGLVHGKDEKCLYWTQYRKSGLMDHQTLSLISTVLRTVYLEDPDYDGFQLKLIDVGIGDEEHRRLRIYNSNDFDVLSQDELDDFFNPVFQALNSLREEGFAPKKREEKKKTDPLIDPNAPSFFDL